MVANWITINETKKATGWSRSTILRYIDEGILDKRQVKKFARIYIDYYSIPTFIRNCKLKGNFFVKVKEKK